MNEIEDFLRRIAQDKLRNSTDDNDDEIIDAEIVEDEDILYSADVVDENGVGGHVKSVFAGEPEGASPIDRAGDQMDQHLREVFEHKLGQLGSSTSRTEDSVLDDDEKTAATPRRASLRSLLRSPQSIRNAIVLSEIINRPQERW
jgi:hypothetical protein